MYLLPSPCLNEAEAEWEEWDRGGKRCALCVALTFCLEIFDNDDTWGYTNLISDMFLDELTVLHEKILKVTLMQPQYPFPPRSHERVLLCA